MNMNTEHLSPYVAAKIVNTMLKNVGINTTIPPQMMYNYVKNGILKSYVASDGRTYVERERFTEWSEAYVAKKISQHNVTV